MRAVIRYDDITYGEGLYGTALEVWQPRADVPIQDSCLTHLMESFGSSLEQGHVRFGEGDGADSRQWFVRPTAAPSPLKDGKYALN